MEWCADALLANNGMLVSREQVLEMIREIDVRICDSINTLHWSGKSTMESSKGSCPYLVWSSYVVQSS